MLVILEGGGIQGGGINFDAKVRRNSTDLEDKFIAHIAGMDVFARGLIYADQILQNTDYKKCLLWLLKIEKISLKNGLSFTPDITSSLPGVKGVNFIQKV